MFKRGVSPVIATVLLIVLVVILASIIFIWARGFLSEGAIKGDRVVESSCEDVKFEVRIAQSASQCQNGNDPPGFFSAIDVNNIGNIPIYGVKVLEFKESEGSIDIFDQSFVAGTIKTGQSSYGCLSKVVNPGDKFKIIPKLLAENKERKIAYTCPEKDGVEVVFN